MSKQTVGKNVSIEVKGNKMTIEIDLTKDFGGSKSGKTIVIATTQGNTKVPGPNGEVSVGVNVYRPKD